VHFPDISVVDKAAKTSLVYVWIDVPGTNPATVDKVTVSVDTADVDDIAEVKPYDDFEDFSEFGEPGDGPCGKAGTVITCKIEEPIDLDAGTQLLVPLALTVTAKPGAAEGADGTLDFTARLDDGPTVTSHSTVAIGQGVDLAGAITKPITVAPGASAAADLRVSNSGTRPVKGVVLVMEGWNPGLNDGETFSNCTYGLLTICHFDDELATATTYVLSKPMRLKMPADAAAGSRATMLGGWYTTSDFKELLDVGMDLGDEIIGKKGTGGPVGLSAASAGKSARAVNQVDTNLDNDILSGEFVVGGDRRADMAAVGATVSGAPGDEVETKLGFVNNGPGTLYYELFDNTDALSHVTVPAGLRATKVDDQCLPIAFPADTDYDDLDESLAGASEYLCFTEKGKTEAAASSLFDFTFEVAENGSERAGKVEINDLRPEQDVIDSNPGNDTAKITVKLSGGGIGGGLPVTGANAGLIGAAGLVLLLAGALGLMLVRRRRVRFTA
jgi:LPXTG-motif cell wall-anchored protein